MMGRLCGGEDRMEEQVDLPVAIEPVRPMSRMVFVSGMVRIEKAWMLSFSTGSNSNIKCLSLSLHHCIGFVKHNDLRIAKQHNGSWYAQISSSIARSKQL